MGKIDKVFKNGEVLNDVDLNAIVDAVNESAAVSGGKTFAPTEASGLGRKIVTKDDTMSSLTSANTVYVITDDIDLKGGAWNVPAMSFLKFEGGSIKNGTLNFNRTKIEGNARFENIESQGLLLNDSVKISWFATPMANRSDFSVDNHDAIVSAYKMAGKTEVGSMHNGWLDFENIAICLKTPIVIDWGNGVGIKNAEIYFVPSADFQTMITYDSLAQSSNHIIDSKFICANRNYENVNVIKHRQSSNSAFTYFKNIISTNFSGYFMVNLEYLQEITFENVMMNGGGIITYNTDLTFDEEKQGTSNILHFLNCSRNNGNLSDKSTWEYFIDLHGCGECTFVNTVIQGFGTSVAEKKPIRIGGTGYGYAYSTNVKIDGMWCEVTSHFSPIATINTPCQLYVEGKCGIEGVEINASAVSVYYRGTTQGNGDWFQFVNLSTIAEDLTDVYLYIDSTSNGVYGRSATPKFTEWLDKGIIQSFKNHNSGNRSTWATPAFSIEKGSVFNIFDSYINKINAKTTFVVEDVNNLPVIVSDNGLEGCRFYDLFSLKCGFYIEAIIRVTLLQDGQGSIEMMYAGSTVGVYNFAENSLAGQSSGWIKIAGASRLGESGFLYFNANNVRLELAECKAYIGSCNIDSDISIVGGEIEKTKKKASEVYASSFNWDDINRCVSSNSLLLRTNEGLYTRVNGKFVKDANLADIDTLREEKASKIRIANEENVVIASLSPNVLHRWQSISSLSISGLAPSEDGIMAEYLIEFTASSNGCILTVPADIKWINGQKPEIKANATYVISIVNNLAVYGEF